jgi:hypothetical protein
MILLTTFRDTAQECLEEKGEINASKELAKSLSAGLALMLKSGGRRNSYCRSKMLINPLVK